MNNEQTTLGQPPADRVGPGNTGAASPAAARRTASYTRLAILLHWTIALLILGQIVLGWRLHELPSGPIRFSAFQLHKSVGFTILALSIARLGWRILHKPPTREWLPKWQRWMADIVHWGFYALMIGLPLTGWIMLSTVKVVRPTLFWGLVEVPTFTALSSLPAGSKAAWNASFATMHVAMAWTLVALLALHIAAVVKHQLIDRDRTFSRMLPRAATGAAEIRFWLALLCAAGAAAVGYAAAESGLAIFGAPGAPHR